MKNKEKEEVGTATIGIGAQAAQYPIYRDEQGMFIEYKGRRVNYDPDQGRGGKIKIPGLRGNDA